MDIIMLLLFLILLNGVLAMSEIAVVSARRARLQRLADNNVRGASSALALNHEPSTFLSTIQVGITTVGILSGAIGESALADPLAAWLSNFALLEANAQGMALAIVVVGLTYFSVVVGELVPKQLALLAPERIAATIAAPMNMMAQIARPLVWLLAASSTFLLRVAGVARKTEPPVTDEEIKVLMKQGAEAGVFHVSERAIVANVLRLDEQHIGAIMTHRSDIHALDLNDTDEMVRKHIAESPYTRMIVCRGGMENIIGILHTPDILEDALEGRPLAIEKSLRKPLYVPEGVSITHLLENFRKARQQCALIVDEYGELQGMVTLTDVMIAIIGDVPASDNDAGQDIVMRKDHSWLIDGDVAIERMKTVLAIEAMLPGEADKTFNTLGGFMMHMLDRIPAEADAIEAAGFHFEVVDMDRNRVDKVLVSRAE